MREYTVLCTGLEKEDRVDFKRSGPPPANHGTAELNRYAEPTKSLGDPPARDFVTKVSRETSRDIYILPTGFFSSSSFSSFSSPTRTISLFSLYTANPPSFLFCHDIVKNNHHGARKPDTLLLGPVRPLLPHPPLLPSRPRPDGKRTV